MMAGCGKRALFCCESFSQAMSVLTHSLIFIISGGAGTIKIACWGNPNPRQKSSRIFVKPTLASGLLRVLRTLKVFMRVYVGGCTPFFYFTDFLLSF